MNVFLWSIILIICFIIIGSIIAFIRVDRSYTRGRQFSIEMFYMLLIIYTIVIIGFGLFYFILSFEEVVLVEDGKLRQPSVLGSLIHSFYFSGVTLLTIGYGDIVPIGIGRLIAVIEALIGYILPTAFVLKLVVRQDE